MRKIELLDRNGAVRAYALVDEQDYVDLSRFRWHMNANGYATRKEKQRAVLMSRQILGLEFGNPLEADHISRDKLDNRRSNLRIATKVQNGQNQTLRGGSSKHRGVHWAKREQRWRAYAWSGGASGNQIHLGYFRDELEAVQAAAEHRREHMPYAEDVSVQLIGGMP